MSILIITWALTTAVVLLFIAGAGRASAGSGRRDTDGSR